MSSTKNTMESSRKPPAYFDVELGNPKAQVPTQPEPQASRLWAYTHRPVVRISMIIGSVLLVGGIALALILTPKHIVLAGPSGNDITSAFDPLDAVATVAATLPALNHTVPRRNEPHGYLMNMSMPGNMTEPCHNMTKGEFNHHGHMFNITMPHNMSRPCHNMTKPAFNHTKPCFNHTKSHATVFGDEVETQSAPQGGASSTGLITGIIFGVIGLGVAVFLWCGCQGRRGR
ncbi:hypothetical protein EK21DRAFT_113436 [Setomelanomma holmii]|uniref:Uncharacterized protein n=1 Tax=Setomelanomma holmii TaxID=210430 RepID=A0A9P4H671_9PLEO|nr:hypothetical protein EK21DRAFT_113436 [Setomelanomma holmii]